MFEVSFAIALHGGAWLNSRRQLKHRKVRAHTTACLAVGEPLYSRLGVALGSTSKDQNILTQFGPPPVGDVMSESLTDTFYIFDQIGSFYRSDPQHVCGVPIRLIDLSEDTRSLNASMHIRLRRVYSVGYTCEKCRPILFKLAGNTKRQKIRFESTLSRTKPSKALAGNHDVNDLSIPGALRAGSAGTRDLPYAPNKDYRLAQPA